MIEGFRPQMKKKRTRTFGKRGQEKSLAGCPGSSQVAFALPKSICRLRCKTKPVSKELTTPASNTFERIKRINERGSEFWSARELARALEYTDFRNFITVIIKAREACANSGRAIPDHFVDITEMVGIGSGAKTQRHVKPNG